MTNQWQRALTQRTHAHKHAREFCTAAHARTRTHTHPHTRTHTHTRTHSHARTHTQPTHTDTHTYTHARAHTRTHADTDTHAHTRTHARTHAHSHIAGHTQTRTGKRKRARSQSIALYCSRANMKSNMLLFLKHMLHIFAMFYNKTNLKSSSTQQNVHILSG